MRTSRDLPKSDTKDNVSNGLVNDKTAPKLAIKPNTSVINGLNVVNEGVINTTNDMNFGLNDLKPSIGKWMYENDDYINELALDLSNKEHNYSKDKSDDIVVIDDLNAGPSGLNVHKNDKNINNLKTDCDLTTTITKTELNFEDLVFDNEIMTISETIDLSSDDSQDCDVRNDTHMSDIGINDVEIIKVKIYNQAIELDADIEVVSEILSPKEVIDLMRNNLNSVQQLTHLSFTTIRIIMSNYNWNKDLFVNQFFEYGIDRILDHFKIVISYELKNNAKRRKTRQISSQDSGFNSGSNTCADGTDTDSQQELKTCLVCFDETNKSDMFGANCGHYLCIECWNQYITTHVCDASSDEKISCPGDNCALIIDDEDIISVIRDQTVGHKYQRLISNSFVTKDPLLRWCPNGDCLHAVRVKHNGFQDIECICKTVFCFLCGDQWHEPLSCDQHKNWIRKYTSQTVDPKSAKWLTKHTKCCPKCLFPIEKNGGCNYVMCSKCRHQFCYNCLGRCSHGRCLKQNAEDSVLAQATDLFVKQDLNNYPKFKDKYQKQSNQLSAEKKLQEGVTQKLEKAVKCPEFKSALKFLKNAFSVLCHCRQTLMYSYVFEYYLKGPELMANQYKYNLSELEKQTSILSTSLVRETPVITKDVVLDVKRKVQSTYRECEAKRSILVQHIRHGLTNSLFQFNPI